MATPLTRADVQMFLRDFANNNILLDTAQFTEAEIDKAIEFAVDEWNVIPPISAADATLVPKSILALGTCAWLMMSESFLQLRNQATYQDGDITPIGIDDKHQFYLNLSSSLKAEWKATAQRYKQQQNMESAYGSVGTGYRYITSEYK